MDLDVTLHGFPLPSFLPRVSHVRATQQGPDDYHTTLANAMPPSHPLLVRRSEVTASQQSSVRVVGGATSSHFDAPADHHHGDNSGSNMVTMQQFLTSVAGDMGLQGFHVAAPGAAGGGASASRPRGKGMSG